MELESLMPESHSKLILTYRCKAHSSPLLGKALNVALTVHDERNNIASIDPQLPFEPFMIWLLCSFRILRAPVCLITPLKNALTSRSQTFAEKRHALPGSE